MTPIKVRHFHQTKHKTKITAQTVRRRLFQENDIIEEEHDEGKGTGDIGFMKLPLMKKKNIDRAAQEAVHHHVEKKLKTTSSVNFNNNDVINEEDPLVLAKALTKDQLIQVLSRMTLEDGVDEDRLRRLLPKPDISMRVSNLTYHMHNIFRSIPHNTLHRTTDATIRLQSSSSCSS